MDKQIISRKKSYFDNINDAENHNIEPIINNAAITRISALIPNESFNFKEIHNNINVT